jgi:Ca2+-dependent lipid-binding protein
MDLIGTADPYVTFHLLGQDQQKSSVLKNTLDPEWNEEFVFYMHDLSFYQNDNQLVLNIWDWDRISKDEVIGEVRLMISDLLGAYATNIRKTVNIMKKGSTECITGHDGEKSTVTLLFSASNVSYSTSNVADDIGMAVGNCAIAMQANEDSARGFMGFLQKGASASFLLYSQI